MGQIVVFYKKQPEPGYVHKLHEKGLLRVSVEYQRGCYEAMGFHVPRRPAAAARKGAASVRIKAGRKS